MMEMLGKREMSENRRNENKFRNYFTSTCQIVQYSTLFGPYVYFQHQVKNKHILYIISLLNTFDLLFHLHPPPPSRTLPEYLCQLNIKSSHVFSLSRIGDNHVMAKMQFQFNIDIFSLFYCSLFSSIIFINVSFFFFFCSLN